MKVAMKVRRDMIAVACDSFMKMFQLGDDELVEQVSAVVLRLLLLVLMTTTMTTTDLSRSLSCSSVYF